MNLFIKPVYAEITNPVLPSAINSSSKAGEGLAFYISQLWKASVVVGALAFLIFLVMGGLEWVLAGGDAKKVESAQKRITNGLVGLIILVATYAIIIFVEEILGINILNIDWSL